MSHQLKLGLMVMSGPDDGHIHDLQGKFVHDEGLDRWVCRFTIGRRDTCDICVPFDTLVSRVHAVVEVNRNGQIWLVDEQSRNGTFFGRERLSVPVEIKESDFFRVGKTWLRVQYLQMPEEVS
jgi:pSer/pThr/pTyr-binding forkhead associated (FHA) protein